MASADLVTLAEVKAWLSVTTSGDDAMLSRLITQVSRGIANYTNRAGFLPASYTDATSGVGGTRMVLRNWPVISVASVTIGGHVIPASSALTPGQSWQRGWVLDPGGAAQADLMQSILLRGASLWPGVQNILVSYTAGYQVTDEVGAVPLAPGPYTVTAGAPYGDWGSDSGVTYASGAALTAVAGAPAAGQYSVATGVYTFAAADAGAAILISYGYIPADLAEACMEMVAERYRYRDRIGMVSKSLGGAETMAFSQKAMSDYVKGLLQSYMRVVPC